jgi:hypothetical protein
VQEKRGERRKLNAQKLIENKRGRVALQELRYSELHQAHATRCGGAQQICIKAR